MASTNGGRTDPDRTADQCETGFDQHAALGGEDAAVDRQQLLVKPQRLGRVTALERLDHGFGRRAAEVGRRADDADAADREQWQRRRVVAGVEGQTGLGHHLAAGRQIALGVLDREDAAVLGQPQHGLGGDRGAGAAGDVVEHHR